MNQNRSLDTGTSSGGLEIPCIWWHCYMYSSLPFAITLLQTTPPFTSCNFRIYYNISLPRAVRFPSGTSPSGFIKKSCIYFQY